MKTLVIYFSQTGNTQKVAEYIGDGIREVASDCRLISLSDLNSQKLSDYDLLGLGTPVFYYKEPFHIREFIENLPMQKGKQWFVFCSHGAAMGRTLLSMTELLEKKDATVIGSYHTYADGQLPFYPYPTLTTGHPDQEELAQARQFGRTIVQCSLSVSKGDMSCILKPAPIPEPEAWSADEAEMLSRDFLRQITPPLSVATESCIVCGDCQEACPVDGIDVEAEPRRIQNPCIYCFNCVKVCPTCSIEADWSGFVKMAPDSYAKYRQALEHAEARGEFHWRVDPDSINLEDPLYLQQKRNLNK